MNIESVDKQQYFCFPQLDDQFSGYEYQEPAILPYEGGGTGSQSGHMVKQNSKIKSKKKKKQKKEQKKKK